MHFPSDGPLSDVQNRAMHAVLSIKFPSVRLSIGRQFACGRFKCWCSAAGHDGVQQSLSAIFFAALVLALVPFTYMCAPPPLLQLYHKRTFYVNQAACILRVWEVDGPSLLPCSAGQDHSSATPLRWCGTSARLMALCFGQVDVCGRPPLLCGGPGPAAVQDGRILCFHHGSQRLCDRAQ